jgi:hypothetical protein
MVTSNTTPGTDWTQLSPQQKREWRLNHFLTAPEVKFVSRQAAANYRKRAQRLVKVFNLEEPDQVPVSPPVASLPFLVYKADYYSAMYDFELTSRIFKRFNEEYAEEFEAFTSPVWVIPGKAYDILDYKSYAYPGHGLPRTSTGFQFVENEYMKADEYDAFIRNPSDFFMRTYMPRAYGDLQSFSFLPNFTTANFPPHMFFMPYANPEVQETQLKLIEVGKVLAGRMQMMKEFEGRGPELGFPAVTGGTAFAPFDTIGDGLRGTQGIIRDMYRQPEKLLAALDVVSDLTINTVLSSPHISRGVRVWFPLHKGADGWMSQKQFETFYWASLKKVMDAFINEGLQITLFAEGSYNTRLESVTDFPKGMVHWQFDQTDMLKAKQVLGSKFSIEGNVPTSLLVTGTPQNVKEYCRKLIETCGPGGGFILASGASANEIKFENALAMVQAAKEYGQYH